MDLCFTKKQILSLLEQDATADPAAQAPTAGTSSKQAGGQGYPEVGKWESGIERGPANQVGVTKWADVVGSKLNRGKANQLKEQSSTWEKEKSKCCRKGYMVYYYSHESGYHSRSRNTCRILRRHNSKYRCINSR